MRNDFFKYYSNPCINKPFSFTNQDSIIQSEVKELQLEISQEILQVNPEDLDHNLSVKIQQEIEQLLMKELGLVEQQKPITVLTKDALVDVAKMLDNM